MAVLVTGGAGYIGSHVVLEFFGAGEEVIVLDNFSTGLAWAVQPGVSIVRGDAGNAALAAVEAALGKRLSVDVCGTDYPTKDGSCLRDYVQVTDLAGAHVAALQHLRAGGGSLTLNCGSGHGVSVFDVIEAVKRVSGADFRITRSPRRAGDPTAIIANVDRIRSELGWAPKHFDLDAMVGQALAWERKLTRKYAA